MDFQIPCTSWIGEEEERILNALRVSEEWLSAEELTAITGLPSHKVVHTLRLLKQQLMHAEIRKSLESL